jgi:uncharacterized membrane protein
MPWYFQIYMVSKRAFPDSAKKGGKKPRQPLFVRQKLTLGQKTADKISTFGGSWTFIILFFVFLLGWIVINSFLLTIKPYDPYPFILLNLVLSCLAAIQAPIILMAQNRQAERDRLQAKYDYAVNRMAERENRLMMKDLTAIRRKLGKK